MAWGNRPFGSIAWGGEGGARRPSAISGTAHGTSTCTAVLLGIGLLVGASHGVSTPTGTASAKGKLSGISAGISAPAGTLSAKGMLAEIGRAHV